MSGTGAIAFFYGSVLAASNRDHHKCGLCQELCVCRTLPRNSNSFLIG